MPVPTLEAALEEAIARAFGRDAGTSYAGAALTEADVNAALDAAWPFDGANRSRATGGAGRSSTTTQDETKTARVLSALADLERGQAVQDSVA